MNKCKQEQIIEHSVYCFVSWLHWFYQVVGKELLKMNNFMEITG